MYFPGGASAVQKRQMNRLWKYVITETAASAAQITVITGDSDSCCPLLVYTRRWDLQVAFFCFFLYNRSVTIVLYPMSADDRQLCVQRSSMYPADTAFVMLRMLRGECFYGTEGESICSAGDFLRQIGRRVRQVIQKRQGIITRRKKNEK